MNAQDVMALTISTTIFRSGPASKFKALGRTPLARVPARGAAPSLHCLGARQQRAAAAADWHDDYARRNHRHLRARWRLLRDSQARRHGTDTPLHRAPRGPPRSACGGGGLDWRCLTSKFTGASGFISQRPVE